MTTTSTIFSLRAARRSAVHLRFLEPLCRILACTSLRPASRLSTASSGCRPAAIMPMLSRTPTAFSRKKSRSTLLAAGMSPFAPRRASPHRTPLLSPCISRADPSFRRVSNAHTHGQALLALLQINKTGYTTSRHKTAGRRHLGRNDLTLASMSVGEYAQRIASADPTPGGGSAAAAVGSFAAGLVRMVAQLTSNSPKFADVADRAKMLGTSAADIVDEFVICIDEDVVAFDRVSAAYKLPKNTDE